MRKFDTILSYFFLKGDVIMNSLKLTDMLISAILKKGLLYEACNVDVEFQIPKLAVAGAIDGYKETKETFIIVRCKAEHMTLSMEKA
jgi:hypothetical protein